MPETTIRSADGTNLAARHSGHGSPMVLVHGANGDLDTFALIESLLAERHSVWVYSRRGRGGSGDGPDYGLEREVEDVLEEEVQIIRSLPEVWARACEGVRLVPREIRIAYEAIDRLTASDPPDIPTLYLYGEETDAPVFATSVELAELLPKAQLHGLPEQRHLGFAFDPTSFAQAVLNFTTAHDG